MDEKKTDKMLEKEADKRIHCFKIQSNKLRNNMARVQL